MENKDPTEQCIFCKIAKKEVPSIIIHEDDVCVAIMDINPFTKGHILVIPKQHHSILQMMSSTDQAHIAQLLKYLSQAQKKACVTNKNTIYYAAGQVAGQQMPHLLIHIIAQEPNEISQQFSLDMKTQTNEQLHALLQQNLPVMLNPKDQLAKILEQNPKLTEMIKQNPQEFMEKVKQNPQLHELFSQVDIMELSKKL